MALPPWAVSAIRRGIADVARRAGDAETLSKLKEQASEILRDLPEGAAKSVDAIVRSAKAGKETLQRWVDRQSEICVPLINASGVFLNEEFGDGLPLDDAVMQVGCDLLRGDVSRRGRRERIDARLQSFVPELSIAVANNLDAAVASMELLAGKRPMVIHRHQAIRLPSGTPLPDAIGASNVTEVGGVQDVADGDFDSITDALILLADSSREPFALPKFQDSSNTVVVILSVATVTERFESIPSAQQIIQAGADLAILPGGGISGGPDCALIVGRPNSISKLTQNRRWAAWCASDAVAAMMSLALSEEENENGSSGLDALINVNEENLRSRAERLATRWGAEESITSCQITDRPAKLLNHGRWTFPSRQLRLRHASDSASDWSRELSEAETAIAVGVDGEDIVVDLRWVRASDDARLAEAFEQ